MPWEKLTLDARGMFVISHVVFLNAIVMTKLPLRKSETAREALTNQPRLRLLVLQTIVAKTRRFPEITTKNIVMPIHRNMISNIFWPKERNSQVITTSEELPIYTSASPFDVNQNVSFKTFP